MIYWVDETITKLIFNSQTSCIYNIGVSLIGLTNWIQEGLSEVRECKAVKNTTPGFNARVSS